MVWVISASVALLLGVLAWYLLPIASLSGNTVRLREILNPNTRLQLRLQEVTQLFEACLPLSPKERLARLLQLEDRYGDVFLAGDRIRKAIVATGISEAIPHIRTLLNLPMEGGRAISSGVRSALEKPETEEDYKVQVFKLLVPFLNGSETIGPVSSTELPDLLLQLDASWGERVLRMPEYCSPDYENFDDVLEAFNARGIKVPHGQLVSWLGKHVPDDGKPGSGKLYLELVKALALHDPASAERRLREAITLEGTVALSAAEILLELRHLPHPRFGLDDRVTQGGLKSLSKVEQTAWLVDRYNYVMSIGGLTLLDDEEYARLVPGMIESLTIVGAPLMAARLQEFSSLFWPEGPASGEGGTGYMIATYGEEWYVCVETIQEKYPHGERTGLLTLKYLLEHEQHVQKRN